MLEFGKKHPDAEYRKSVGAVIYDPETNNVIGLDWGLEVYGIVQGGQDSGEDEIDTLKREIVEETGYTDFDIIEKLGENITSYFYAGNKNTWRELELACYLVRLNSHTKVEQNLEDDEEFKIKWVSLDKFISLSKNHIPTDSENFQGLGVFLERARAKLSLK